MQAVLVVLVTFPNEPCFEVCDVVCKVPVV